jgi:hypothetical protein
MQECLACQNVSVLQLNFMRGYIVLKEALHLIHLLNKKPRNLQYNITWNAKYCFTPSSCFLPQLNNLTFALDVLRV